MAGIYIHIPFCSQFCTYCNFYSVKQLGLRESFVKALCNEILLRRKFFSGLPDNLANTAIDKESRSSVTTLYIGGGTPSVLLPSQLQEIVGCVRSTFDLSALEEFTIEVNPNDITAEYAGFLVELGVNRVSMGVQSFIDEHLVWMNRRHTATEGVQAYQLLRNAGIRNMSLDLIFGFEKLSGKQWHYNISKAIELAPEHISAYQMSVEPDSALGVLLRKGEYSIPSQEVCEAQYIMLQQMMEDGGYRQYEISNFARYDSSTPRQHISHSSETLFSKANINIYYSKHNSSYWQGVPYLGLGPGAHSYNGTERIWNYESVKRYCTWYNNTSSRNSDSTICGMEHLTETDKFNEAIMLGLRRTCGLSLNSLNRELLRQIEPEIDHLVRKGLLIKEPFIHSSENEAAPQDCTIRIPANKLFISDSIIRELFV